MFQTGQEKAKLSDESLTGLPATYGTEYPRVDSGIYLGISRSNFMADTKPAPKPAPSGVTALDALKAAMSPTEVLARPHDYEKWYNGMRAEALANG